MKTREDRRIRRSRQLLGDALLALLQEHDLSAISIRQVTNRADVGYMTFYRHYNSLDELLVDRIRALIEQEIDAVVADCDRQGLLIFEHAARHAALYRTLLFSPNAARARRMLEQTLAEFFLPTAIEDALIPVSLRAQQAAASVITLIRWWFETGMTTPIDRMAAMYNRLVIDPGIDLEKMRVLSGQGAHQG